MSQVKIENIFKNDKDVNKNPYVDKNGVPFWRVKITTKDGLKATAIVYEGNPILLWKDGETHDINIIESNGYTNFTSLETQIPTTKQASQETKSRNTKLLEEVHSMVSDILKNLGK